jgi:archaeal type IV pilus assembly protein PilA
MKSVRNNERAVSPVIGVILMVAVTVILAAIVAAFVFGMTGQIKNTKIVGATLERTSSDGVTSTYYGGLDSSSLVAIRYVVDNSTQVWTNGSVSNPSGKLELGTTTRIPAANTGYNHVTAIGVFSDGSEVVISERTL